MVAMKDLFNRIDTDGNGIVSVKEFKAFMAKYLAKEAKE